MAMSPIQPGLIIASSMSINAPAIVVGQPQVLLHLSRDAGRTWRTAAVNLTINGAPAETFDPSIAFDGDGKAVLVGAATNGAYVPSGKTERDSRILAWSIQPDGTTQPLGIVATGGGTAADPLPIMAVGVGLVDVEKPSIASLPNRDLIVAYSTLSQSTPAEPAVDAIRLSVSLRVRASQSLMA
ncbi:MAG: hypothetical protein ACYDDF_08945 [Thermoplasmatota archaeon]